MSKINKLWVVNKMLKIIDENKCKQYELSSIHKQVLIALAYFYNKNTKECWPSINRLSYFCSLSERTIRDTIKSLVKLGLLTVTQRINERGDYSPNIYTIDIKKLSGEGSKEISDLVDNFVTHKEKTSSCVEKISPIMEKFSYESYIELINKQNN